MGGSQRTIATYDGLLSPAHYIPGIGDALAGAAALVIGAFLLRLGLTTSIKKYLLAWNIYGALDLCIAVPINLYFPPADERFFTPVLASSFLLLHIVSIVLLLRNRGSPK